MLEATTAHPPHDKCYQTAHDEIDNLKDGPLPEAFPSFRVTISFFVREPIEKDSCCQEEKQTCVHGHIPQI